MIEQRGTFFHNGLNNLETCYITPQKINATQGIFPDFHCGNWIPFNNNGPVHGCSIGTERRTGVALLNYKTASSDAIMSVYNAFITGCACVFSKVFKHARFV